ncbi:MAG: FecR family protein [Steroidobacteraceae bacterium]
MSEADTRVDDTDPDALRQLLERAGRRPEPPVEIRDAVYLSTLVAWQDSTRRRRNVRLTAWALAASVVGVAIVLALMWRAPGGELGAVVATSDGPAGISLRIGETLDLSSQSGRVLELTSGQQLRLASGSRLRFVASDRARLEAGRVYFASQDGPDRPLRLDTPLGTVSDVGTRYSVELSPRDLRVRVRDGRVRVNTSAQITEADSGVELRFDATGQEVGRRPVARHGDDWRWVDALAPPMALDGRPLLDVLEQIAYESGRQLSFADTTLRGECERIELHGPVLDLSLGDRLFAVLVTTGFEAVENGDMILIRRRTMAPP